MLNTATNLKSDHHKGKNLLTDHLGYQRETVLKKIYTLLFFLSNVIRKWFSFQALLVLMALFKAVLFTEIP